MNNAFCDQIIKEFPILFSPGLGKCNSFRAKFVLTEEAVPVQTPCRQIPYVMETSLKEELQRLESQDIIERVHLSNWSTPVVIVKKPDGRIRLCADYSTGVNRALRNNTYPLPNADNIITKVNSNSYFSVLDLSDAFLQIEVAEDHRDITTITTPKRVFRFKRLPFCIKTAPAIFQQAINHILAGLKGVYAYIDDVIIMGSTQQEHDKRLRATLQRLEERDRKLKPSKCRFALQEIKYLGIIINESGISADPEATRAITEMPKHSCVAEVQT
ncbi:uncharacterized protein K02A2.6-like [Solenopsis invicta]|uniref:uncharacterized protein K02A2.6-like n=1 Tax=Solenopsis invicta TaxID=13686 RepID=UPI000E33FF4E|nr:uncharacterized protein K02A2.6-like [Solenopsis invicta]